MPDEYGLQFQGLLQNAKHTAKDLTGVCIASVVPQLTGRIVQACREYLKQEPLVVDAGVKTGVRVKYDDPKQVGADRVVNAVAAIVVVLAERTSPGTVAAAVTLAASAAATPGWVKVRHRDGQTGFVRITQVFGL